MQIKSPVGLTHRQTLCDSVSNADNT